MRRVTIADVSREAGVSKSTVSNFINGRFDHMSPDTQARIHRVIKKLGYYPSVGAQVISKKGPSKTICVVIPRDLDYVMRTGFFSRALKGIGDLASKANYRTLMLTTDRSKSSDFDYMKGLSRGLVDGFILLEIESDDSYVKELYANKVPFMAIGSLADTGCNQYVDADNAGMVGEATEHLIGHGHERIALLGWHGSMVVHKQATEGYRQALQKHGIPSRFEMVKEGLTTYESGYEQTQELLMSAEPPTAMIGVAEKLLGAAQVIKDLGRSVPNDVALIGIAPVDSEHRFDCDLSIMQFPAYELGYEATKMLLRMIYSDRPLTSYVKRMPAKLVTSESCGCKLKND